MYYDYYSFLVQDVKSAPVKTQQALVKVLREIDAAMLLSDIPKLKKLKGFKKAYTLKIGSYKLCIYQEKDKLSLARLLSPEELNILLAPKQENSPPPSLPEVPPAAPVRKRAPRKTALTSNPSPRIKKTPLVEQ